MLAFTSIDLQNQAQAQSACWLFGSIYVGVALPTSPCRPTSTRSPFSGWSRRAARSATPTPNQNDGHCIPAVSYDADDLFIVTWGQIKAMRGGFYNAYADESFAVISEDFVEANGLDPAGFDLPRLRPT